MAAALTGSVMLVACSAVRSSSQPTQSAPTQSATPPASAVASASGQLPDLGLTSVRTEAANARAATIGPAGGTISTSASDGTTYELTVPAGALEKETQIAMYPVDAVAALPTGATLAAGVQFVPDGLALSVPAKLDIGLPAAVDPKQLVGLTWSGDGESIHAYPAIAAGNALSLDIYHFSGGGAGKNLTGRPSTCSTEADMESVVGFDWQQYFLVGSSAAPLFVNDLRACYHDFVAPTLTAQAKARIDENPGPAYAADAAYDFWFNNVGKLDINEGRPMVSPELNDSGLLAGDFLRNWYDSWNLRCSLEADNPPQPGVQDAILAISLPHAEAQRWGLLATQPGLADSTLLHKLCVQVVIGPSRTYGANQPGDTSAVHVPVGYTLNGTAVRTDLDFEVVVTLDGAAQPFSTAIVRNVEDSVDLTWPQGTDPIKINIVATLMNPAAPAVPTLISTTDQITKNSCKHGDAGSLFGYGGGLFRLTVAQASPTEGICAPAEVVLDLLSGTTYQIVAIGADGSGQRVIGNGYLPKWSPDHSQLCFSAVPGGQVMLMSADGTNQRPLAGSINGDLALAWSPDGKQVAFGALQDGMGTIFVSDVDGVSNRIQLTHGINASGASWSPDGTQIAFESGSHLWVMNSDGSGARQVSDVLLNGPGLDWSPTSDEIVFAQLKQASKSGVTNSSRISIINADGSGLRPLTTYVDEPAVAVTPVFSLDGSQVAYVQGDPAAVNLFVVNADGSGNTTLSVAGGRPLNPDW